MNEREHTTSETSPHCDETVHDETLAPLGKALVEAMAGLDEVQVLDLARQLSERGCSYHDIVLFLNAGVKKVGDLFETGEYFIGDLIVAGMVYRAAISMYTPDDTNFSGVPAGKVIIGVVEHDIHDIGKDIVISLLRAENFDVMNLGIDVKPERFIYAVQTYEPDVLLLSGMMRSSQSSMMVTLEKIRQAGLRDHVAVLVGGGCANADVCKRAGADAWAVDPMDTLQFCKDTVKRSNR